MAGAEAGPAREVSGIAIRVLEITRENPLKTHKNAKRELTHGPKTRARHDHDPGGPRGPPGRHSRIPPRARSASLEG
jgi:hypothetical protein